MKNKNEKKQKIKADDGWEAWRELSIMIDRDVKEAVDLYFERLERLRNLRKNGKPEQTGTGPGQ